MSAMPEPIVAADGLIARDSGPWAEEKLLSLDGYAQIFTKAMTDKFAGGLTFVDLMSGPGICVDTHSPIRREFPGSTLRALDARPVFTRVVAIESDVACAQALRARVQRHARRMACDVRHDDCNSEDSIRLVREATRSALSLVFVDLIGTEVNMDTIRQITTSRSVDLVITWPVMDALRNRGMLAEPANRERWTRFLGSTQWLDRMTRHGPAWRVRDLQHAYIEELRRLKFDYCQLLPTVRNIRGHALYRPLFASRNALGLKFWNAAQPRRPQLGFEFE